MKELNISVAVFILAGCFLLQSVNSQEDWLKCEEGSDLFPPPRCPWVDPAHPVYFPFPYNCKQYYECSNDIARCLHCPPGTMWDQALESCDHESWTECEIVTTGRPPTLTSPTTTTTTTTKPYSNLEPDSKDPIHWICPVNYKGLIRHPCDCEFFYNCDPARRPCLFDCQGLYFNPAYDTCDWPESVPDCVGGTPPPTSPTPNMTELGYSNNERLSSAKYTPTMYGKEQQLDMGVCARPPSAAKPRVC